MKNRRTVDICVIGIFVAIIAIVTQISIPMPSGIPMTLQTFVIALAGVILGSKRGAIAAGVYVLLGAVGLPVFSFFTGGLGVLAGPTGGFIIGFPLMAFLCGLGIEFMADRGSKKWLMIGLVSGIAVDYLCGIILFMIITGSGIIATLAACVVPFIIPEVIKTVLVATVGVKCRNALINGGILAQ